MHHVKAWLGLPIEGEAIRRFAFSGNGKHARVEIALVSGELVTIPTDDLHVTYAAGLTTRLKAIDDVSLSQEVLWPDGGCVRLSLVQVGWWLPPEEWSHELERRVVGEEWQLSCYVPLRVGLAHAPDDRLP